jgi:hypothetical protein
MVVAVAASVAALLAQAGSTADSVVDGFVADAEAILAADVATNRAMGDHGARRILEITGTKRACCEALAMIVTKLYDGGPEMYMYDLFLPVPATALPMCSLTHRSLSPTWLPPSHQVRRGPPHA